jgi:hypothetical protein
MTDNGSVLATARRRLRAVALAGTAGLLVTTLGPAGLPASAAETAACLRAVPVDEVVPGMTGEGLTVSRGTTPEPFTATVDGVLTDGIAPGVDMIVAVLASPALDDAKGVWSGMSGSPVYADDGRLIGAVAYGLGFGPSMVAGITPAEAMGQDLLAADPTAGTGVRAAVPLPRSVRRSLVGDGAATPRQAAAGLTRLPLPLAVSGLRGSRLAELVDRLGISDVVPYSASATAAPGDPADIVPGGNFAAALSYGDLTMGGVGTTTAVCGSEALAFGHPLAWAGATTEAALSATALRVQDDPTLAPFKVANLGGVVGTVDQDRLVGLHAALGEGPDSAPVTSTVAAEGRSRAGRTDVVVPDALPDGAAFHTLANVDRVLDSIGKGSSTMRFQVSGTRADGSPWTHTRTNRFASPYDISFESIVEMYDQVAALVGQPYEQATVDAVDVDATFTRELRSYDIASVRVRDPRGRWRTASQDRPVAAVAGSRLAVRVTLHPYRGIGPERVVPLALVVPPAARGGFGILTLSGGASGFGDFGDFVDFGDSGGFGEPDSGPAGFEGLLADLAATPRNDELVAALTLDAPRSRTGLLERTATARADRVVEGYLELPVEVVRPPRARPGRVDGATWRLRSTLSSGRAQQTFRFGATGVPLMGDWDGDGRTSPARFSAGRWVVRTGAGSPVTRFTFGRAGDRPVVGDWDGDGRDGIGVLRDGRWLLRQTASPGSAAKDFRLGPAEGWPVAGDWNGNGRDTVASVRNGRWRVARANADGAVWRSFRLGRAGDRFVAGDWDADGRTEPGSYRRGTWLLGSGTFVPRVTSRFDFGGRSSRPVVWLR